MISLRDVIGKPIIHHETAEQVGQVRSVAIDPSTRSAVAVVTAEGRSSRVIEWTDVHSIGPDAVIVDRVRDLRPDEDRLASGAQDPIKKRVLSDRGNEHGSVTDVIVDEAGLVQMIDIDGVSVDGTRLRGLGSYALVIEADATEA